MQGLGLGVGQVPVQMQGQQEAQGARDKSRRAWGHAQQQGWEQVQGRQGQKQVQRLSKGQGQVREQVQVWVPMHPVGQNTVFVAPGVGLAYPSTVTGATLRLT